MCMCCSTGRPDVTTRRCATCGTRAGCATCGPASSAPPSTPGPAGPAWPTASWTGSNISIIRSWCYSVHSTTVDVSLWSSKANHTSLMLHSDHLQLMFTILKADVTWWSFSRQLCVLFLQFLMLKSITLFEMLVLIYCKCRILYFSVSIFYPPLHYLKCVMAIIKKPVGHLSEHK